LDRSATEKKCHCVLRDILVEAIARLMYSVANGEGNSGVTHSLAQSINVLRKLDSTLFLFLQNEMYFYFS
jgi:hypothetical protein